MSLMSDTERPAFIQIVIKRAQAPIAWGFDRVFLYEFEHLQEHLRVAEEKFIGNAEETKRRLHDALEGMDEEERARYTDLILDDEWYTVVDSLPSLQWYAQFLVVYSRFEHSLSRLCRIVQKRSNFRLSENDLHGQGIRRAATYLAKVAGVESPFSCWAWQHAILLGEIRNCIAHNNGMVLLEPNKQDALSNRARRIAGISLDECVADQERAQLKLSPLFVRESITRLQQVLSSIANYELYAERKSDRA
jgi:hypothetical protein